MGAYTVKPRHGQRSQCSCGSDIVWLGGHPCDEEKISIVRDSGASLQGRLIHNCRRPHYVRVREAPVDERKFVEPEPQPLWREMWDLARRRWRR